jgi:hypothetical protein
MAPWFPFADLRLSVTYANIAILLAPEPQASQQRNWRERARAAQTWQRGKAKAGADFWALQEVASWVTDVLVHLK